MVLQASLLLLVSLLDTYTLGSVSYIKPVMLSEFSFVNQTQTTPSPSPRPS
jgi:hypothetical protein